MNRDVKLHMAGTFTLYAKLCFFFKVLASIFSEKWTYSYVFVKAFNQEIKNTNFSKHVLSRT